MKYVLKKLYWLITDYFYPHVCSVCYRFTDEYHWVTGAGSGKLERAIPMRIYTCGACVKKQMEDD